MSKNRRYTVWSTVLLVVLAAALALSACGEGTTGEPAPEGSEPTAPDTNTTTERTGETSTTSDGQPITIGFGVLEFQRQSYEPLVESFNEENPDIRVQIVPLDDVFHLGEGTQPRIEEIMHNVVSSADTAAPLFSTRPEDIESGYVRDLKPLMDADPTFDSSDFFPGALTPADESGGVYLLPDSLPVPVLSYNKDLWLASGLPEPAPDWSWNDLTAAAEQLAQKRGETVETYGMLMGGAGMITLFSELDNAGLNLFSTPAEELQLDSPTVQAAFERIKQLHEAGAIYVPVSESGVVEFSMGEGGELVSNGQVGIWIPSILNNSDEEPDFEVGTAVFPVSETPASFFGSTTGYIMSSGTQHPQEAWRWLAFLSRQELDQPFGTSGTITRIPSRKSIAERSGYWDDLDEEAAAAVRTALEQHTTSSLPRGLSSNLNVVWEVLSGALAGVASNTQEVDEALREAQQELSEQLAELQLTPQPTPPGGPIVVATPAPEADTSTAATQINFSTHWFGAEEIRRLATEFNAEHPDVAVKITNIPMQEDVDFSQAAADSDCFFWQNEPAKEEFSAVLDLMPLADADPTFDLADYPPEVLEAYQQGTSLYGLPYTVNFTVLMYNQDAFDAAGADYPRIEWTVDEFLRAVEQVDSGGDEETRTYGYIETFPQLATFFYLFDAPYTTGSGETLQPNYTDPQVVEAIQFYINLLQDFSPHKELKGYRQGSWSSEPFQLLSEGRAGMWFDRSTMNFVMMGQSMDFTLAVAPAPLGERSISAEGVYARGFHISAGTEHTNACWDWITYLSTDDSLLQGGFPARLSMANAQSFTEDAQSGAVETFQAYHQAFQEQDPAANATPTPDRSNLDTFWLLQAVDRAMQGENLEQELANAQELTGQFLACLQTGEEKSTCATTVDPSYEGYNLPDEEETEQ